MNEFIFFLEKSRNVFFTRKKKESNFAVKICRSRKEAKKEAAAVKQREAVK